MRCDVFRGIGGVAHKYYMLFQHHLPPPPSTYTSGTILCTALPLQRRLTTEPPDTGALEAGTQGTDPNQLAEAYVAPSKGDPSYIIGAKPGPYVAEHSYNIYTRLGARMALVGIDARVEVSLGLPVGQEYWNLKLTDAAHEASNQLPRDLQSDFREAAQRASLCGGFGPTHQALDCASRYPDRLPGKDAAGKRIQRLGFSLLMSFAASNMVGERFA